MAHEACWSPQQSSAEACKILTISCRWAIFALIQQCVLRLKLSPLHYADRYFQSEISSFICSDENLTLWHVLKSLKF